MCTILTNPYNLVRLILLLFLNRTKQNLSLSIQIFKKVLGPFYTYKIMKVPKELLFGCYM